MIANVLELLATSHVYQTDGEITNIVRVAPVYHRLINAFKRIPAHLRKTETWYRPELEPFDTNYNRLHKDKMRNAPYATLHTDPEPWINEGTKGTAVITTETLYFPSVVSQLVAAAHAGCSVYAVNHFYPPVVGKRTINF